MTSATATLEGTFLMPGLTVNDLAASIQFYQGLGFAVDQRWEEDGKLVGVSLRAGKIILGLSQDDWAKGRNRVKGLGLRLWVNTDQDIDALAASARAAGITLDGDPENLPWGLRGFAVTDPDGYKLTISRTS